MKWRPWRAPRQPSIARPPLPGLPKVRNGKALPYRCVGGPYDGAKLPMRDGTSVVFSVAGRRGRYECAIVATQHMAGVTSWRAR